MSGHDGVHPDPLVGVGGGDGTHQPVDAGSGGGAGREVTALPVQAGRAAGTDDRTTRVRTTWVRGVVRAVRCGRRPYGVLDGEEGAGEVHSDRALPHLQVEFRDRGVVAEALHPGVGDHHVQRSHLGEGPRAVAVPESSARSSATARRVSGRSRSTKTTCVPPTTNRVTTARPMPEAAPATATVVVEPLVPVVAVPSVLSARSCPASASW